MSAAPIKEGLSLNLTVPAVHADGIYKSLQGAETVFVSDGSRSFPALIFRCEMPRHGAELFAVDVQQSGDFFGGPDDFDAFSGDVLLTVRGRRIGARVAEVGAVVVREVAVRIELPPQEASA